MGEGASRNRSSDTLSGDIGILLIRNDIGIGSCGERLLIFEYLTCRM